MIKAFDAYGREIQITREDWRKKVLPGQFKQHWNNPEMLATCITQALRDDFPQEALEPSRQLQRIDPDPRRGATLLGVTLLQLKQFKEAESVLTTVICSHGEEGNLLTNLAKAYAGLGDQARADATLWRALEVNPNLDNGLLWYVALQKERGGEQAEEEALLRLAALPGSWRPQLWLARRALQQAKDLSAAMAYYHQALQRLETVPGDVLMQISGDLGNAGHLMELLELCAPRFDAKVHGLTVGNNLIKAYVDTGQADLARRILEQLYAQQRPDWKQMLLYWDGEIDKLDKNYGPVEGAQQPEISVLVLEGPIWAREGTPFSEILPAKNEGAVKVAFLCGSVELAPEKKTDKVTSQPTDAEGRFTRALPLYLAEQMHLQTNARALVLTPWVKHGGFVVSGKPWDLAQPCWAVNGAQYLVSLHLNASREPWTAQFTLTRLSDNISLASWEEMVNPQDSAMAIQRILTVTIKHLHAQVGTEVQPTSEWLFPPSNKWLPTYLVGLEQALAVSCTKLVPDDKPFLSAERSIIENHLNLSVEEPNNLCCRFLLLSTLEKEASRKPGIAGEFKERIERLQREKPLAEPAESLANAAIGRIFSPS